MTSSGHKARDSVL